MMNPYTHNTIVLLTLYTCFILDHHPRTAVFFGLIWVALTVLRIHYLWRITRG